MATKIFISYRRWDSSGESTHIYDCLERRFGRDNVFIDVDSIPPGVDFRQYLHAQVARCDVLLVVIGRDWLNAADPQGRRRLDDPGDFVRIEIEAALERNIRVIPVLVREASMPRQAELPGSLRDLAFRNAVRVRSGPDFRTDMDRLIRGLEQISTQPGRPPTRPPTTSPPAAQGTTKRPEIIFTGTPQPTVSAPVPAGKPPARPARPAVSPPPSHPIFDLSEVARPARPVVSPSRIITNSIGLKLAVIPAGEFMMGWPDSAGRGMDDQKPQHRVKITKPFCLGIYQVTQAEYQRVMGNNPSALTGEPTLPVERVSWKDAATFCRKLSKLPEEKRAGHVYRLPTEAEWEYACRAGSTTRFCFGDALEDLAQYAWCRENSGGKTHPVGQKMPNAWGLYDMHGNVCEWCADWRDADYYRVSPVEDPSGPRSGKFRILRGGSCYTNGSVSGSADRYSNAPGNRSPGSLGGSGFGFRVARTV